MADVRAYFGISRGGALALTAVALLSGGDYHQSGAERVGHKLVRVFFCVGTRAAPAVLDAGCDEGCL